MISIVWGSVERPVTQPYGPNHRGVDIGLYFEPLFAARPGTVTSVGWGFLSIAVDGTNQTDWYLHIDSSPLRAGARVGRGTRVATSGAKQVPNGPPISGPHLHFEVQTGQLDVYATSLDPVPVLTGVYGAGSNSLQGAPSMKVVQGIGDASIWKTNLVERYWIQDVGELGELLAWTGQASPAMAHQSTIDRIPVHASQKDVLDAIADLRAHPVAGDPAVLAAVQQVQATLGDTNAGIADLKAHPAVAADPAVLALVTKIEGALAKTGAALATA